MDRRLDREGARALNGARDDLDARRPYKPLDVGNGIVSGSVTPGGRWLEVGTTHPRHGRVVLTDAPRFEALAHDEAAVRAYRAALASRERPGFGLGVPAISAVSLLESSFPLATHQIGRSRVEIVTFAPPGARGVVQLVHVSGDPIDLATSGAPRLSRAAYTQLTPGGPLPRVLERARGGTDDGVLWIADDALGAAAAIAVARGSAEGTLALAIALASVRDEAIATAAALARDSAELWERTREQRRAYWHGLDADGDDNARARRATSYAIDCASARIDASTAVLADHMILPLVWTRDAYYVCRWLLALDAHGLGAEVTARFLRWCFETAERPGGWWPRASLASGQAKDPIFQLDQQLYPLLLLEDHARMSGDRAIVRRFARARDERVRSLLERRSAFGLIATMETPADDPIEAPYHFSSHVLLWRVLRELDPAGADSVRDAVLVHFDDDGMFAYAVRGPRAEGALRYHDANDLPTVFAPGWGFCGGDDPRWRSTIDFAWSSGNRAFVAGRLGGLGSVHTQHPWPLGDLQEIVVARVLGDVERERRARERLAAVATWDAMLPEAYDETAGGVASRHWFAWPTSLWALLERTPDLIAP